MKKATLHIFVLSLTILLYTSVSFAEEGGGEDIDLTVPLYTDQPVVFAPTGLEVQEQQQLERQYRYIYRNKALLGEPGLATPFTEEPTIAQYLGEVMTEEERQSVKDRMERFIRKLDPGAEILEVRLRDDGLWILNIRSQDAALLIGKDGKTLEALNYLANIIMRRIPGTGGRVLIDIEGYRERRLEALRSRSLNLAEEVKDTGEARQLTGLNPYERRVVHLALKDFGGVKTESSGDGDERVVNISPLE